jgi:autotransporter-associated beta strand protein
LQPAGSFAGLYVAGGTANSVQNTASISGDVGLRVQGGTTSLTNLGMITGTGGTVLQIDSGTLQLTNGNGTLVGNLVNDGVFAINRTETWTFSGAISGTGEFQQAGPGTTILTGTSTYIGPTNVNAGVLLVNGSIGSSGMTTVNAGGTLAGNGIVGNTFVNGGTLSPGNSIGTLTVQGSLVFTAASSYMVEVSPAAADRTNVAGIATLGGATVNVSFAVGTYVAKQYTVINAAGGVSGAFAGPVNTNLPTNFRASLSYDANDVYLNLTAALGAQQGLSGNQQTVANGINGFFNGGGALPPGFVTLFGLTGTDLLSALSQVSGEVATGIQQTTFDAMSQFMGLLTDPFIAGRGDPISAGGSPTAYAGQTLSAASRPTDAFAMFTKAPVAARACGPRGSADRRRPAATPCSDRMTRAAAFSAPRSAPTIVSRRTRRPALPSPVAAPISA